RMLATATAGGVILWETTFWQKRATLGGGNIVKFWPARAAVVVAGADHTVRIYDLSTRQLQTTLSSEDEIVDLAVSPDARTVVTCRPDGVTILDSSTRATRKLP